MSGVEPTELALPRGLLLVVLCLTVVVLGLGAAVFALQVRGAADPATPLGRELASWDAVIQRDGDADWAYAGRGMSLLEARRGEDARHAFEEALRRNPDNEVAALQLGLLLVSEDPERAEELLATAAELAERTHRARPLVALGDLRLERGDAEAAREAFEGAVSDLPFVVDGHLGLARALEALGDEAGAEAAAARAARFSYDPLDPQDGSTPTPAPTREAEVLP
jgi:tetratricopeptide (TPR) repeat protein